MQGGPPCKDPLAQFCNVAVTEAAKRGGNEMTVKGYPSRVLKSS